MVWISKLVLGLEFQILNFEFWIYIYIYITSSCAASVDWVLDLWRLTFLSNINIIFCTLLRQQIQQQIIPQMSLKMVSSTVFLVMAMSSHDELVFSMEAENKACYVHSKLHSWFKVLLETIWCTFLIYSKNIGEGIFYIIICFLNLYYVNTIYL